VVLCFRFCFSIKKLCLGFKKGQKSPYIPPAIEPSDLHKQTFRSLTELKQSISPSKHLLLSKKTRYGRLILIAIGTFFRSKKKKILVLLGRYAQIKIVRIGNPNLSSFDMPCGTWRRAENPPLLQAAKRYRSV
jgi:hypothetical protein